MHQDRHTDPDCWRQTAWVLAWLKQGIGGQLVNDSHARAGLGQRTRHILCLYVEGAFLERNQRLDQPTYRIFRWQCNHA